MPFRPKTGRDLLEEIKDWPLEAKDDDTARYFFHVDGLPLLLAGKRNYVIGRKGTGKTSIAEYLRNYAQTNYFAQKLTFKNFPFNTLYELQDNSYTSPNQYITMWKYVMYSALCRMLIANEAFDHKKREFLKSFFPDNIEVVLQSYVKRFRDRSITFSAFGVGGGVGEGGKGQASDTDWAYRISILEEWIFENIDSAHYLIVFDELDEDYKDVHSKTNKAPLYFDLLTSLYKASQDIRSLSQRAKANIIPVIFLRNDIYDLLRDPDKNKWRDRTIDLSWKREGLTKLLAYRISRAIQPDGDILDFGAAWDQVFSVTSTRYGNRKRRDTRPSQDTLSYILRGTYMRPRDLVSFVKECARIALEDSERTRISNDVIKLADEDFSNYMRREIVDEVHSVLPDIEEILDVFADIRKPIMPISDFKVGYSKYLNIKGAREGDDLTFERILEILFHFGVIGNITSGNYQVFRSGDGRSKFNFSERICLHRGLLKCLHIY